MTLRAGILWVIIPSLLLLLILAGSTLFLREATVVEEKTELDPLVYLWEMLGAPQAASPSLNEQSCHVCVDMR